MITSAANTITWGPVMSVKVGMIKSVYGTIGSPSPYRSIQVFCPQEGLADYGEITQAHDSARRSK